MACATIFWILKMQTNKCKRYKILTDSLLFDFHRLILIFHRGTFMRKTKFLMRKIRLMAIDGTFLEIDAAISFEIKDRFFITLHRTCRIRIQHENYIWGISEHFFFTVLQYRLFEQQQQKNNVRLISYHLSNKQRKNARLILFLWSNNKP